MLLTGSLLLVGLLSETKPVDHATISRLFLALQDFLGLSRNQGVAACRRAQPLKHTISQFLQANPQLDQ
jgi:hypothetical protein